MFQSRTEGQGPFAGAGGSRDRILFMKVRRTGDWWGHRRSEAWLYTSYSIFTCNRSKRPCCSRTDQARVRQNTRAQSARRLVLPGAGKQLGRVENPHLHSDSNNPSPGPPFRLCCRGRSRRTKLRGVSTPLRILPALATLHEHAQRSLGSA